MGLDMYLERRSYVKNWEHEKNKDKKHDILIKTGGKKRTDIKHENITNIIEEVGYWRKANAIHNWFVENTQNGEDNCNESYVSLDNMKELLRLCNEVIKSSKLVKGKIQTGYTISKEKGKVLNMEDGEYIEDSSIAQDLLPTQSGFFFGSEDYDEYYMDDIKYTQKLLKGIIKEEENGEYTHDYYYNASW